MPVTIVEAALGVADSDDRLVERLVGVTHRFGEGSAQIAREVLVAVIGEPAVETLWRASHALLHEQACDRHVRASGSREPRAAKAPTSEISRAAHAALPCGS